MMETEARERTAVADTKDVVGAPPKGHRGRWIAIIVGVLVLGGVVWQLAGHPGFHSKPPPTDVRPVPVAAAAAVQKDVPI
jgi:hypothetical protein